jgi:predicted 3-demethylubiquinone-9 3-methyltransferase (glyoxalase superfamily)
MQKITPFLWFDRNAETAMNFYASIFRDTEILDVSRQGPDGPVVSVTFRLNGQEFIGLNGGPEFRFTEAISFFVSVDTQEEVDELWDKLSDGGQQSRCGWLKDKFGVSWQVIPTALGRFLSDKNPAKAQRVMEAMLRMEKIDIAVLEKAHALG